MFNQFNNGKRLQELTETSLKDIKDILLRINEIEEINQLRVLNGFRQHKVSESHFHGTTGYGYDDFGRDTLEAVYANVFGSENALVRPQIISGTHAITLSLFGVLRPGDELLYITGHPYDTLEGVIGLKPGGNGSLRDFGINCGIVELKDGTIDVDSVCEAISAKTKMIAIQRSRGYDRRPSLNINEIERAIREIKRRHPRVIVFVDNCYGEFVEDREPCHVGADLIAGSLIKNPGAGIVPSGGYIAGRKDLVDNVAERLTAPGLGKEVGPTGGALQAMYQGLFLAPHVTAEAVKGAVFTSRILEAGGLVTEPNWNAVRTDLVQSVIFEDRDKMVAFCQAIQAASPINAHVKPVPSPMPGYEDDVIMAAGTFVQGSSIELTADGPLRPPYIAFVQGGLTFSHVKIAVLSALDELIERQLI
ncbi:MAG: aminotransferase class I/II-fold pyridoxal phosphate-dependent enzyme [Tuberibacillus sp.]